jgi:hypothetical protein
MMERWLEPERLLIAPTLSDDELRCRKQAESTPDADADPVPMPKRQRAREQYGEPVCKATIYGRARRARLKAARESDAD